MLLRLAAERRLLFLGGKGGVGKTSVASAVAHARATAGARVLLVSTDPAHNLGHLWERSVGDRPTRLLETSPGWIDGVEIDPDATATEHLASVQRTMLRLLPERMHGAAREHLERARTAPGTHESAVLDRLASWVETGIEQYDLVVVDTAPTGHTLRLLALPDQLTGWTEGLLANRDRSERFGALVRGLGVRGLGVRGSEVRDSGESGPGEEDGSTDRDAELRRILIARHRRMRSLRDAVADSAGTAFVVVLTAERLPVSESIELIGELERLRVPFGGVVVNRRSPADAGDLLAARRSAEAEHLARLRRELPDVPLLEVPLLPGEGTEAVEAMAALLKRS